MIDWQDEGIVLTVRKHGETAVIAEMFTAGHGRHLGVVRGGVSRRIAPVLQPGAQLSMRWTARLDDHLGAFTVEPLRSRAADLMASRLTLAGLGAVTALLGFALPEREAMPELYAPSVDLLDRIGTDPDWTAAYLRWELTLLETMGYGLDLSDCAATGATEGLAYVSPRSGHAVSREGAGDWADRLLPLPPVMLGVGPGEPAAIRAGLRTTGHFLATRLAPGLGDRPLPAARQRFLDVLDRD